MLLQFRRSPGVLPACRHILEQSGSAEARFHAACALREGMLREWASLPVEERTALRTYVLQYVLHHAAEPQLQVVRSILEGTLAVMLKRGWMDADDHARAAFFQVCWTSAAAPATATAAAVSQCAVHGLVCPYVASMQLLLQSFILVRLAVLGKAVPGGGSGQNSSRPSQISLVPPAKCSQWLQLSDSCCAVCCCLCVLQELSTSSQAVGSAPAQVVALQVMEAAVSEFSLVTASPIGLSWEYHESCRNLFEVRHRIKSSDTTCCCNLLQIIAIGLIAHH